VNYLESYAIHIFYSNAPQAANSVSADYDMISGFFEELDLYLNRLKILEGWVPAIPELKTALAQVLTSVLVLCGVSAKYVKMKRFGKCVLNPCCQGIIFYILYFFKIKTFGN
jgi:hypothetical protein